MTAPRAVAVALVVAATAASVLAATVGDAARGGSSAEPRVEPGPGAPPEAIAAASSPERPVGPTLTAHAPAPRVVTRGDVTVRVVGPTGAPLPGRRIGVDVGDEVLRLDSVTDATGTALVRDLPWDGSADVVLWEEPHGSRVPPPLDRECTRGPEVLLRAQLGVPLRVHVVDAETGLSLQAVCARSADRLAETCPGGEYHVDAGAEAHGYVAWDPPDHRGPMSVFATSLFAVRPLRHVARVTVVVTEHDGSAPRDPRFQQVRFAGKDLAESRFEPVAPGEFALRGVPFLRGEPLRVGVVVRDHDGDEGAHEFADGSWRIDRPASRGDEVTVHLPGHAGEETWVRLLLPPPAPRRGGTFVGRGGSRSVRSVGCGSPAKPCYPGTLVVTAVRRGGAPAAGASVRVTRDGGGGGRSDGRYLDRDGRAVFLGLEAATYRVFLEEPGLVTASALVDVVHLQERVVALVEGEGARLRVEVLDREGRGLPFATLSVKTVEGPGWVDLGDDGVQRIDPFTDHLGRRTLEHVDPGEVTITATWGSRTGKAVVQAEEGRRHEVRIVLE
jgi:hypothetical protein